MNTLDLIADDYTAYGIQHGTRPAKPPAVTLTARDLELLAFVYDFAAAPTSALADLFWGRYSRPCHRWDPLESTCRHASLSIL